MTDRLLSLHLSQTQFLLEKSKNNNYSDEDKQSYQTSLFLLFQKIKASITDTLTDSEIYDRQEHLKFIFDSLEFLKDSTLNAIPFEVVSCLNLAMNDWVDSSKFIIVTSLNNNIESFSYDPRLAVNEFLYQSIKTEYNIEFPKRLVQINLPLILSRDYFSSVILYHELGHFIDIQYKISGTITFELLKLSPSERDQYLKFLPFIHNVSINNGADILHYHIAEYICDIFAAQYIGYASNFYLKYITKNSSSPSHTHPATTNRVALVEEFLQGSANPLLHFIIASIEKITGKKPIQRYSVIQSDDFYKLIPLEIRDTKSLHGAFPYGWEVYLGSFDKFKQISELDGLTTEHGYRLINNLLEKSIGNYFVIEDWKLTN